MNHLTIPSVQFLCVSVVSSLTLVSTTPAQSLDERLDEERFLQGLTEQT